MSDTVKMFDIGFRLVNANGDDVELPDNTYIKVSEEFKSNAELRQEVKELREDLLNISVELQALKSASLREFR